MLFFHCPGTSDSRPPVFHPLCRCNDILFYVSIFFLARHTFAGYRLRILHVRFFTQRTPADSVQAPLSDVCHFLVTHPSVQNSPPFQFYHQLGSIHQCPIDITIELICPLFSHLFYHLSFILSFSRSEESDSS